MLAEHPDILEAGIVAVPDSHWGERPKAFITVKAGKHLDGQAVIEWAKHTSGISKFMVPREVEIVAELPKTSTGKIKKNVLREWVKGDRGVNWLDGYMGYIYMCVSGLDVYYILCEIGILQLNSSTW